MVRILYWALCGFFLIQAVAMFFASMDWYNSVPGVVETGPFNMHFIMDIGLIFLVSALLGAYGLCRADRTALVAGACWPALHALFHIYIWFSRETPIDLVAASNLFGLQLPAWLMLGFALKISLKGQAQ